MPESDLTTCVHCGHKVSRTAMSCPSCKRLPQGVVCAFCGQRAPSESAAMSHGLVSLRFCDSCLDRHFTPPAELRCLDCKTLLPKKPGREIIAGCYPSATFPDETNAPLTCPSCGSTRPYGNVQRLRGCSVCGLPLFPFHNAIRYHNFELRQFQRHEFCQRPTGCLGLVLFALVLGGSGVILTILFVL